jgi:O-6-methylguanine DNA methyltransferase
MSTRQVSRYETSWGPGWVWVSEGRLVAVDLPETRGGVTRETTAADRADEPEVSRVDRLASRRWVAELEAYFRGERMAWTAEEISLDTLVPEPFAHAVYVALLTVPAGETVAYGELAEMAGYPRAARAVGNVMAANPIPVVIPCHRVIRADGTLGNYGNDPAWKKRLLEHERAGGSPA